MGQFQIFNDDMPWTAYYFLTNHPKRKLEYMYSLDVFSLTIYVLLYNKTTTNKRIIVTYGLWTKLFDKVFYYFIKQQNHSHAVFY